MSKPLIYSEDDGVFVSFGSCKSIKNDFTSITKCFEKILSL